MPALKARLTRTGRGRTRGIGCGRAAPRLSVFHATEQIRVAVCARSTKVNSPMRCWTELASTRQIFALRRLVRSVLALTAFLATITAARAIELDEARGRLQKGAYDEAITAAEEALKTTPDDPEWRLLHANALANIGKYSAAEESLNQALSRSPLHLRLRLAAYDI